MRHGHFLDSTRKFGTPHLDPQYCINPVERLEYDELRTKYKIESLEVRRKGSLLQIMYNQSKDSDNLEIISHDIN